MATAQLEKVKEDFLTCVVCSDFYTDPCTLSCQHSFCRKCINDYIKTKPDAIKSKTIPCPCCLQVSNVLDPSRPVEEWAGQLKPGLVIQGLIDTLQPVDIGTETGRCCSVCEHLGETTPATSWCQECDVPLCDRCRRAHSATPSSRDHKVDDLSAERKIRKTRKVSCREHKDEIVKFHCKDCKKSACQTCCIIYHRACKSVVTIESMKSVMKSVLCETRHVKSKRLKIKSHKVGLRKTSINDASKNKLKILADIQSVSQKVIETIKKKEKQLTSKLDEVIGRQVSQLKAEIKSDEIDMQLYKQNTEFIDQALISDCVMDMYDAYQACESGTLVMEARVMHTEVKQEIQGIRFSQDTEKMQTFLRDLQLGAIDVTYQDVCDPMLSPLLYSTTNCRTKSDMNDPDLCDVMMVVVDGVRTTVVNDYNNKCVKSFYTRNNQSCHSTLPLDNSPCGITQLKENQVMVAVPNSCQIITVEVTPDLVLLSTITTRNSYNCLAVLGPTSLAAGGDSPSCVDILNMEGQVMKSVSTHNHVKLFKSPNYVCVSNKGNILVSDAREKSVTCLTAEGDVVWIYAPTEDRILSAPKGITISRGGHFFLVDSKKVIQLSESGQFVRDILLGLDDPSDIYVDIHGSLFISEDMEMKEFIFA